MRTVVYPHKSKVMGEAEGAEAVTVTNPGDSYTDKLAKYLPGEVIAFFAPLAAFVSGDQNLLIAIAAAGLVGTFIYLFNSAKNAEPAKKPRPYFYVLACISFAVWAIATSQLATMIGLTAKASSVMLGITVFLVPGIDMLLSPKTSQP